MGGLLSKQRMANPSINMPDGMKEEIDARRPSTVSRSAYVSEAISARFRLEDRGEWEDVTHSPEASDNEEELAES